MDGILRFPSLAALEEKGFHVEAQRVVEVRAERQPSILRPTSEVVVRFLVGQAGRGTDTADSKVSARTRGGLHTRRAPLARDPLAGASR